MTHASQGQHWYAMDGTPVYEVPRADGKGMRSATLKDARKLGLVPGVTSIIKCASAPALEKWKRDQVLMAALTLPRIDGESCDQLNDRIMADSEEQGRKARDWGTAFHAAIQGHFEGKPPSEEMWPFVQGVLKQLAANFGEQGWKPEQPCAHRLGFGTKADLSSRRVIVDFKGSEFDEAKAPTLCTYDEHHMQLAATRKALTAWNDDVIHDECAIAYVSRIVPGLCRIIRVDEPELEQGWEMFCGLHSYWCAKNRYWPAKQRLAA